MNELFSEMKKSGAGCHIDEYYAGMFGYADDLLLLCPSRDGLQKMLEIAEEYANDHRISFSTNIDPNKSKTKGIILSKKEMTVLPVPVNLNSNPLPWVSSGKYLGNKMSGVLDGYQNDARKKCGSEPRVLSSSPCSQVQNKPDLQFIILWFNLMESKWRKYKTSYQQLVSFSAAHVELAPQHP